MTTDEPRPEIDLSAAQIAARFPCMKLQHVEVLVKTMYMQLSEKIDSQWQGDRRGYRKTSELREPLFLLPKGSYHGEESTPAGPKLVQRTVETLKLGADPKTGERHPSPPT